MGAECDRDRPTYVKEMSVVITTGFGGDLAGVGVLTGTLTSSLRETESLIMSTTTYLMRYVDMKDTTLTV
jgi:hypothetical protein